MSEGNHSTNGSSNWSARMKDFKGNKPALFVAALGVAVLSAGLFMQIFRAPEGNAQSERESRNRGQAGTSRLNGKPVARVGDISISYDTLAAECFQRHGKEVLEKIINRAIIQQACQKRGIQITETEVAQEVQSIAQKFQLDVSTWYQMLQAERNLTPVQYQHDIIWPMLALRSIAGKEIEITNVDRRKAFERDYSPRVRVKMIMLDNLRRAEEVWHKATQEKEDFSRLARDFSIEPTSRALGGDIPPIRRHIGSAEVIKQAFKLKTGEISGIIQAGPQRYVILLCEGFTEQIATYEEVRELIEENLLEEKRQEAVAKVFEKLKNETRVDNLLTQTTTGDIRQTSAAKTSDFDDENDVVPTSAPARPKTKTSSVRSPFKRR